MILTVGEPAWAAHDGAPKGRPFSEADRAFNSGVANSGLRHYPQLLSPLKIGRLVLRSRIISGPLKRNLCDRYGRSGLDYERNIEVRAEGGAALIVPEATFVSPEGRGSVHQMGCHHDDFIPDLRRLTEAAHEGDALIAMQLNFAGRQAQSKDNLLRPVSASGLPCAAFAVRDMPQILDRARIDDIAGLFADAARRAKEAGFDIIELHGAHGYLLGEFLSPLTNRRDDEYGGPPVNRARLALRVYDAVLAAVGADFPISYRISAEEMPGAGLSFDDVRAFSAMLQDRGLAMLSISAGTCEARGKVVPMSDLPTAFNAPLAGKLKAALDVPVAAAGRINDPSDAEAVLRRSQADAVVMTRALHADPALPAKTMSGQAAFSRRHSAFRTAFQDARRRRAAGVPRDRSGFASARRGCGAGDENRSPDIVAGAGLMLCRTVDAPVVGERRRMEPPRCPVC
jgi:2,4-dienoyl-CoA reductase-like NADH-dependent reductase (Old Yellow Enzyme family)